MEKFSFPTKDAVSFILLFFFSVCLYIIFLLQMAETVKKSRIVSDEDENLEEALIEEFNMRLKNCMSNVCTFFLFLFEHVFS